MNLADVLNEIGTALSTTDISVYTTVPEAGDYPAIVVNPPTLITYTTTHAGGTEITVPVTIYAHTADLASTWIFIYRMLSYDAQGFTSIADALLNHTASNYRALQVSTASNFRPIGDSGVAVDITLVIKA